MSDKDLWLNKTSVKAFLALLKSSLWDIPLSDEYLEKLNFEDWISIYRIAYFQTVDGLIAERITDLPEDLLPEQTLRYKFMLRSQQIQELNVRMNQVVGEMAMLFKLIDLTPILQKGQGIAQYYPKPLLRVCGDIDWYFPKNGPYEEAYLLMDELTNNVNYHANYSCGYTWKGLHVEHHQHLIQIRNPWKQNFLQALLDQEKSIQSTIRIGTENIPIPKPVINSIMINMHILNHQIGYGIGLRQMCDAAMLYESVGTQLDADYLTHVYKKLDVLKWIHVFHQTLVDGLGLDERKLPIALERRKDSTWMMSDILYAGNFAFHDPRYPDITKPFARVKRVPRLFYSFKKFFPLAPIETISFPIMQVLTKFHR